MLLHEQLYVGTSGIVLPVANKLAFPEEFKSGTRLTYYSSLFNSLEVNSSFYKIPRGSTFAKWVGEVPEGFRFTVKLWRGITHEAGLAFKPSDVDRFVYAAAELGVMKGCLLVQLPPSAHADKMSLLERLLERIRAADAGTPWKIAVEFRHRSWYVPATAELLSRYRAGLVLHDMPVSKVEQPAGETSFIYLRYHGVEGDYKGGYADEVLQRDALRVKEWLGEGKEVYAYFNNTIGDALINASRLAVVAGR